MRKLRSILAICLMVGAIVPSYSQVMRRKDRKEKDESSTPGVTFRMKEFYEIQPESDANKMWEKVVYRQIDLTKGQNMALYYPEEPTENQESLFRLIMKLVTDGQVPVYEYLDGSLPKVPLEHLLGGHCCHHHHEEEGCHCHCGCHEGDDCCHED